MQTLDIKALSDYFRGREDVAAAYLFGSAKGGRVREGGDVDVAVLYRAKPRPAQVMRTVADIVDVTGVECVDVVTLNTAEPILAVEALRGRLLCRNDAEAAAAQFSLACREYEDVMAQIERQRQWARELRTARGLKRSPRRLKQPRTMAPRRPS
ncbi:nucleotidyltransferase domain-containing protein [bacterium]|nr:nucleotidyltransferase domain-containing protein [bacterium]